jgi:diguanylate cyclase (GGDEF)-like protein/PAS domain S-box-containing protein
VTLSEAWSVLLGGESKVSVESMASLTGLVPDEDRGEVQAAIAAALKGPESAYRVEHRVRTASGVPIWIVSEGRVVERAADGRALRMIGTNRDITERIRATNALRESEERFRGAMHASPVGMAIVSIDGRWLKVNPALSRITGYSEAELQGMTFQDLTHPEDREIAPERLQKLLEGECESYQIEKRYLHKDGHEVWVEVNVSVMRDATGASPQLIAQILDVSERHRMQRQLEHLALHDVLTGLPNSRLLQDRLEQTLAATRRNSQPMGLMYLDLDEFKPVNDTYGHAAGDLVLKEFASRVAQVLRETDTIARIGGDEFVAVLGQISGEADARRAAERVLSALERPFDLGNGQAARVSASIGLALFPQHGQTAQELKQHADAAMYAAKQGGRNSYRFFAGEQQ